MTAHRVLFAVLHPDGALTDQRAIRQSDIQRCPNVIMLADHYRADGSCRCDDPAAPDMAEAGYEWTGEGWSA